MNKFFKNESGATAIEYGLMVGLIALAMMVGLTDLGTSVTGAYDFAADEFDRISP